MNIMQKSAFTLAILAATSMPALAAGIDLAVSGTVAPSACTPTIAGGGAIDYGNIKADTLSADSYTVLDVKTVDFTITCDAPTKVAIKAINNRTGSNASGAEGIGGAAAAPAGMQGTVAGLGLDGTAKVGGYTLTFKPSDFADGKGAALVISDDNNATWKKAQRVNTSLYGTDALTHISWAGDENGTEPAPFTTLSAGLSVQAYINKASELDLSKPVTLDGSTTIELVYL